MECLLTIFFPPEASDSYEMSTKEAAIRMYLSFYSPSNILHHYLHCLLVLAYDYEFMNKCIQGGPSQRL